MRALTASAALLLLLLAAALAAASVGAHARPGAPAALRGGGVRDGRSSPGALPPARAEKPESFKSCGDGAWTPLELIVSPYPMVKVRS